MATEVHVAGCDLEISGRFLIQRCSWCGAVLLAYDYANTAVAGDTWEKPATFPVGGLVRFTYDGTIARWGEVGLSRTMMVPIDDERLPDDACAVVLGLDVVAARPE